MIIERTTTTVTPPSGQRGPLVRATEGTYDPIGTVYEILDVSIETVKYDGVIVADESDGLFSVTIRGYKVRKNGERPNRSVYPSIIYSEVESL